MADPAAAITKPILLPQWSLSLFNSINTCPPLNFHPNGLRILINFRIGKDFFRQSPPNGEKELIVAGLWDTLMVQ
jgi:hypothetical protein